jgi:hypothetical protein
METARSSTARVFPLPYFISRVAWSILDCARPPRAGSSGLSRLSSLSSWSDLKFIQKRQTDQKDQPTRQTNSGALREHRRSSGSVQSSASSTPIPYFISRVAWSILDCARRTSTQYDDPSKLARIRCSRVARMSPPLRASNEGSPRPRVARAQGTHRAIRPSPAIGWSVPS